MRPTKRTKVHRVKPEISKLMKLKYRINDVYRNGAPGLLPDITETVLIPF